MLRVERVHLKRVIPCLDVDAGRVVKGVEFVDIRDAGDPVELAAHYDREGADELSSSTSPPPTRSATRSPARPPHRRRGVHPVHDRRRHPLGRRRPGGARRGRRQGVGELRRAGSARAARRARRASSARSASCSRSTPRPAPGTARRTTLGGVRRRRAHADAGATSSSGRARASSGARGRSCSRAWTATAPATATTSRSPQPSARRSACP